MAPSPVKDIGLIGVFIFDFMMTTYSITLVPEVAPPSLPACEARRLRLEGISIVCKLHETNIPLYCSFCLKGDIANETLGIPTYRRPYNISGVITGEYCEYTYFPKRIGTYTFLVIITNTSKPLVTNDVIISELPDLKLQRTCHNGRLRVTCIGIWHEGIPFIRMSRDGRYVDEIMIRSELVVDRNDTYFTEAILSFGDDEKAGFVNVTCEAMYRVQSYYRYIGNSSMVYSEASRQTVKVTIVKLSDSVFQCKAKIPHTKIKLALYCTTSSSTTVHRRNGESPLTLNITEIGNFRSARCACKEDKNETCQVEAEVSVEFELTTRDNSLMAGAGQISPIFRDSYGILVNRTYVITAGTIASLKCLAETNEINHLFVTVICWNQNGEPIIDEFRESMPVMFDLPGTFPYNRTSCICQITPTLNHMSQTIYFIFIVNDHQQLNHPVSPLSDSATGKDSVSYEHYALAGIVLLAFLVLVTSAIVYVYLYWKDLQRTNSTRSSPSPTQSNDYACIQHSPQSSKSSSEPGETSTLIDTSSPPGSNDDSGSGGSSSNSNHYFNDSPRTYEQMENTQSENIDVQSCLPFRI